MIKAGDLAILVGRLVEQLCGGLVSGGRSGRTVGIKVRLDDFSTHTRAHTVPEPIVKEYLAFTGLKPEE